MINKLGWLVPVRQRIGRFNSQAHGARTHRHFFAFGRRARAWNWGKHARSLSTLKGAPRLACPTVWWFWADFSEEIEDGLVPVCLLNGPDLEVSDSGVSAHSWPRTAGWWARCELIDVWL